MALATSPRYTLSSPSSSASGAGVGDIADGVDSAGQLRLGPAWRCGATCLSERRAPALTCLARQVCSLAWRRWPRSEQGGRSTGPEPPSANRSQEDGNIMATNGLQAALREERGPRVAGCCAPRGGDCRAEG
eukprot:jgi/Tetstr1/429256/TSEL_019175.t1